MKIVDRFVGELGVCIHMEINRRFQQLEERYLKRNKKVFSWVMEQNKTRRKTTWTKGKGYYCGKPILRPPRPNTHPPTPPSPR